MAIKTQKIDKKDQFRALLTDTSCGDVPLIFSNDGFYINTFRNFNSDKVISPIISFIYRETLDGVSQSSPYKYNIGKGELTLRKLSLTHPRAQLNFCTFYAEFNNAITYLCGKSQASIRAPYKVTNSLFLDDGVDYSPYKNIDIDMIGNELFRRHASSFFAYRGHNRFYKFFKGHRYSRLEKRFSHMRMLDIANCFDSVYTHTIAWAVKNKDYNQKHMSYQNQFSVEFDTLIRRSNNNETNGIPIGSEVSRVFAEIIFQKIDVNIINTLLEKMSYRYDEHYHFVRYVDDYVVFASSSEVIDHVSNVISDELSKFNLYINDGKIENYSRPFTTKKSSIVADINRHLDGLYEMIFNKDGGESMTKFMPRKIFDVDHLLRNFVNDIKSVCYIERANYQDVSSYLISCLSKKLIEMIESPEIKKDFYLKDESKITYVRGESKKIIYLFLKTMFFFYFVNPQAPSSNKLAKTIMIVDKFLAETYPDYLDFYRGVVMDEITEHFPFKNIKNLNRENYATLENLNILLSTSDFGENYLLPQVKLMEFINSLEKLTYFEIISVLFYIKRYPSYADIRHMIEGRILEIANNKKSCKICSEKLHLFLDSMSCPYISHRVKNALLERYLEQSRSTANFSADDRQKFIAELQSIYWFVKWTDLDLIKLLERKELNASY